MPAAVKDRTPLSTVLPPLIFGTATFNHQYNKDPYSLDTNGLVQQAVFSGIRAFDTSPYYGPAEELLGDALDSPLVRDTCSREDYCLLTKVGRVSECEFDYSVPGISKSIERSLDRLRTDYLDVVYCHDVEFVTQEEALSAIKQLRRIRDKEGTIKYVGISGYPVGYLCRLADRVLKETGEPLDIVMSYASCTLQNNKLVTNGVKRLKKAGVDVVANGSPLGMGLLRSAGPPIGLTDFHPAGAELRMAIQSASDFCDTHGESLENIAIRYALETWAKEGSPVGSTADPASGLVWRQEDNEAGNGQRLGVSVIGVSTQPELTEALQVWRSILDGLDEGQTESEGRWKRAHELSINRQNAVKMLAEGIQEELSSWVNYSWPSPPPGFVKLGRRPSQEDEPWRSTSASPANSSPRKSSLSPMSPSDSSTTLTPSSSYSRLSERVSEKLRIASTTPTVRQNPKSITPPESRGSSNTESVKA